MFINAMVDKNETSDEVTKQAGEMMCGDQWAFFDLIPEDLNFEVTKLAKVKDYNLMESCEALQIKLSESTMGKFLWKLVAPFLKGHVLYTPVDEFTQKIIYIVSNLIKSTSAHLIL